MRSEITKYTILNAIKDKLFLAIMLLLALFTIIALFIGSTSIVEQGQTSIVYVASSYRLLIIFGLILFSCFQAQRAYEGKEIELMLSRPISRERFLVNYFIAFGFVALGLSIVCTAAVYCIMLLKMHVLHHSAVLTWCICMMLESIIMTFFALFVTLISGSAVFSALMSMAFYVMSRLFGFMMILANNEHAASAYPGFFKIIQQFLRYLSIFFPRFDMLTKSEWLIYGISFDATIIFFIVAVLFYIPLILVATIMDFNKRQF